jgi:hypothetical protein
MIVPNFLMLIMSDQEITRVFNQIWWEWCSWADELGLLKVVRFTIGILQVHCETFTALLLILV